MRELTNQENNFVLKYISNGFNGAKAAREAKYSAKAAKEIASRLLTKANIKEAILKHFERQGNITQRLLAEYIRIATSNITDFVEIDDLTGTTKVKPLKDIPKHMTSAIKKIKEKRVIKENADGSSVTVYNNFEYELYDKQKSLDKLIDIAALIPTQKLNLLISSGSGLEDKLKEIFEKYGEKKIDEIFKLIGD